MKESDIDELRAHNAELQAENYNLRRVNEFLGSTREGKNANLAGERKKAMNDPRVDDLIARVSKLEVTNQEISRVLLAFVAKVRKL